MLTEPSFALRALLTTPKNKIKSSVASGMAFKLTGVGVGDVGVSEVAVLFDFKLDNYQYARGYIRWA